MNELAPISLGFIIGLLISRLSGGIRSSLFAFFGIATVGFVSTLMSGEYHQSWFYVLPDSAEAALGLCIGWALSVTLRRAKKALP